MDVPPTRFVPAVVWNLVMMMHLNHILNFKWNGLKKVHLGLVKRSKNLKTGML